MYLKIKFLKYFFLFDHQCLKQNKNYFVYTNFTFYNPNTTLSALYVVTTVSIIHYSKKVIK